MAKSMDKTTSGRRRSAAQSTSFVTPKSARSKSAKVLPGKSGKGMVGSFVEVVDIRPGGHLVVRETMHEGEKVKFYGLKDNAFRRPGRRTAIIEQRLNQEGDEIIARVLGWAGGEDEARKWYRSFPIPAFGDRTAESLVKAGNAEQVREYLDAVATGAFS